MSNILKQMPTLLHGDASSPAELFLTYAVGIIAGVFFIADASTRGLAITTLQAVVLFALAADVMGGVIANATRSTNTWYRQKPLRFQLLFIAVHIAQPLIAVLVLDNGNWGYFVGVFGYMAVAASLVVMLPHADIQRPLAAALYIMGVIGVSYLLPAAPTLLWFAPAYFFKLIVAFGVNHYGVGTVS